MHIVLTFPFALGIPGGGTYAFLQTARHLKLAGSKVTVIPLQSRGPKTLLRRPVPPEKEGRKQIDDLREIGIEVMPVPVSFLTFALDGFSMRTAVSNYISQHSIDAIICWHHEGALLGKLCEENQIMFAMRAVGNYERLIHHTKGLIWSTIAFQMIKRVATQANFIWTGSMFTSQEIRKVFNVKADLIKRIPEGINPIFQTIQRNRNDLGVVDKFIFVGSWAESKGVFDAISAFGRLANQGFKDWEFHIIGWGDEDKVIKAIEANRIVGQVKIIGKLDHFELFKAMESAHVLINPSHIESFALAVHEAQLAGLPVIAYATGAVPEVVDDQRTGWLVPLSRVDLLTEALIDSIKDPERTYNMGMNGRYKFFNRYTWPRTAQMMLDDIERYKKK